jgi:uncharacterized protein YndB with AHSA1/START domain
MGRAPELSYEIYIAATPKDVWRGLVDGEMTQKYVYGTRLDSTLSRGARFAYVGEGGFEAVSGEILAAEPEHRLVMRWQAHWDEKVAKDRPSRVSYQLDSAGPEMTRLRLRHDEFESETATYLGSAAAWPWMMSSLKSLLETGKPLPPASTA